MKLAKDLIRLTTKEIITKNNYLQIVIKALLKPVKLMATKKQI